MNSINQRRGPTTGNTGTPAKVSNFHQKHSAAETLAGSVTRHFEGARANFTGRMELQPPLSLPKTTGKKK